jgi:hypothetical protein
MKELTKANYEGLYGKSNLIHYVSDRGKSIESSLALQSFIEIIF